MKVMFSNYPKMTVCWNMVSMINSSTHKHKWLEVKNGNRQVTRW